MQPGLIPDIAGSAWLSSAASSVYKKLKDCQLFDMLKCSLNPTTVPEEEWQHIAEMGAHGLAQACMQRATVVAGSFVPLGALQELNCTCVGQVGLATAFRHLELHRLLGTGAQDSHDDVTCASIVAAIYGELLDTPVQGESAARENARNLADWALLDFIFLLGATRISFAEASTGDSRREDMPSDVF